MEVEADERGRACFGDGGTHHAADQRVRGAGGESVMVIKFQSMAPTSAPRLRIDRRTKVR